MDYGGYPDIFRNLESKGNEVNWMMEWVGFQEIHYCEGVEEGDLLILMV